MITALLAALLIGAGALLRTIVVVYRHHIQQLQQRINHLEQQCQ